MPPAPGAVAMAAMVDPCLVVPFCPGPLAAGAMGCWGPPGGQSCRENALSDFTAYFTTFFRKKIHQPMGFSTSSEILVEKRRRIILILWYRKVCGPPGAAFSRDGSLLAVCALFRTASPPTHTQQSRAAHYGLPGFVVKRSCYSSILPKLKSAKSSTRSVRLGATGAAVSASRGA